MKVFDYMVLCVSYDQLYLSNVKHTIVLSLSHVLKLLADILSVLFLKSIVYTDEDHKVP